MNKQKINIDLDSTTDLECDECKEKIFVQAFLIKKISALMSPTGEEALVPVQVFQCKGCGHINEQFLPRQQ
jgi:hypothetical protein